MTVTLEAEIDALEGRLLAAWVAGPSFRTRYTPAPEDFYTLRCQAVARACVTLAALGPVDLGVQLVAQLARAGDYKKLWALGESPLPCVTVIDPDADLERWRKLRALKALRDRAREILERIQPSSDLDGVRSGLLEAVTAASARGPATVYSDEQLMGLALQAVTRPSSTGSYSGFEGVDRLTGGIRQGHVWCLGAPTNFGKTSMLLAMADHCLQVHRGGVLLISCEDDPELLALRLACRRARVKGTRARDGRLSPEDVGRVSDEILRAKERGTAPVMLDGRGRRVEDLARDIRATVAAHGTKLVLVDYLQAVTTDRATQDRRGEINHIARTITDAIKTSGAGGVMASQLTGEDIRESRDVEHAAEVVLIGRKTPSGELSLFVKKNKTGPAGGVVNLRLDPITGAFDTSQWSSDDAAVSAESDDLCRGSFVDCGPCVLHWEDR